MFLNHMCQRTNIRLLFSAFIIARFRGFCKINKINVELGGGMPLLVQPTDEICFLITLDFVDPCYIINSALHLHADM